MILQAWLDQEGTLIMKGRSDSSVVRCLDVFLLRACSNLAKGVFSSSFPQTYLPAAKRSLIQMVLKSVAITQNHYTIHGWIFFIRVTARKMCALDLKMIEPVSWGFFCHCINRHDHKVFSSRYLNFFESELPNMSVNGKCVRGAQWGFEAILGPFRYV